MVARENKLSITLDGVQAQMFPRDKRLSTSQNRARTTNDFQR